MDLSHTITENNRCIFQYLHSVENKSLTCAVAVINCNKSMLTHRWLWIWLAVGDAHTGSAGDARSQTAIDYSREVGTSQACDYARAPQNFVIRPLKSIFTSFVRLICKDICNISSSEFIFKSYLYPLRKNPKYTTNTKQKKPFKTRIVLTSQYPPKCQGLEEIVFGLFSLERYHLMIRKMHDISWLRREVGSSASILRTASD